MRKKTPSLQPKVIIKHRGRFHLVALSGNRKVGRLVFKYDRDENPLNRAMDLDWVEVYPKWRGRGIATKLLKFFLKEVKEKYPHVVWISAWTGREIEEAEGHAIYKKVGFRLLGVQKDFYAPGVHCRLYVKRMYSGAVETIRERVQKRREARRRLAKYKMGTKRSKVTKKAKKMYSKSRSSR